MPEGYLVPGAEGIAELTEKRSRFIGHVWRVETEEEALEKIREIRAKHHDARHNCWCWLLPDGGKRYSDDGEPQGTAGQPMLEFFQRTGVSSACCVVTRYFGGILLGPGGLVRAYTQAAKDALQAAGLMRAQLWRTFLVPCPYPLFERVRLHLSACGGTAEEVDYGEEVRIRAVLPSPRAEEFLSGLTELSGGGIRADDLGEAFRILPVEED
jgi:uncharacterized YigZ family protein